MKTLNKPFSIFLVMIILFTSLMVASITVEAKTIKMYELTEFCRKGNNIYYNSKAKSWFNTDIHCYNTKTGKDKVILKCNDKYHGFSSFYCKGNKLFVVALSGGTGNGKGMLVVVDLNKKKIIKEIEHTYFCFAIGQKLYYEVYTIVAHDNDTYMESTGKWESYDLKSNKKSIVNNFKIKEKFSVGHACNKLKINGAKYYISKDRKIIRKKGEHKKIIFTCKKNTRILYFYISGKYMIVEYRLNNSSSSKNARAYLVKTNGKGKTFLYKWFHQS